MITIFENQKAKLSMEYLYCVEKHHTISIIVESEGFKGTSNFCISSEGLERVKALFKEAESTLQGVVEFKDYDSDAFMKFNFASLGKLDVVGQIGASYNDHYMKFKFQSDQTIVKSMISFINESLNES